MVSAQITGLDVLRAAVEGTVETPPAAALLGWEALSLEPGHVRVRYLRQLGRFGAGAPG